MGMGKVNENREKDGVCLWKQDKGSDTIAAVRNRKSLCCRKLRSRNVILTEVWVVSDSCQGVVSDSIPEREIKGQISTYLHISELGTVKLGL